MQKSLVIVWMFTTCVFLTSCKPKADDYEALLNDNVIGGPGSGGFPGSSGGTSSNPLKTWNFDTSTNYVFDSSFIEVASGRTRLVPMDLTFDSAAEFSRGTYSGTAYSGGVLTLGSGGGCDATSTNCSDLSADWTPEYGNLEGYWKMDNDWNDSFGSNNGTPSGAAAFTTNGKIGSHSGDFEGTTSYVTVGQYQNRDLSVSAWFRTTSLATNQIIVFRMNNDNLYPRVYVDTTGFIRFQYRTSGTTRNADSAAGLIQTNTWYHVMATYSETAGAKIYINGELVGFNGTGGSLETGEGFTMLIGHDTAPVLYFSGQIDDVALWKVELAEADVSKVYERQKSKFRGEYDSEIIDIGNLTSWESLSWLTDLPFGKDLPGSSGGELNVDYSEIRDQTGTLGNSSLSTSLVSLWHFNELGYDGFGTDDFEDSSGNNLNAAENNGVALGRPGILEKAVQLDGTDDFISIAHNSLFNFSTNINFSVAGWVKTSAATRQVLLTSQSVAGNGFSIYAHHTVPGAIRVGLFDGANSCIVDGSVAVNDSIWHHITVNVVRAGSCDINAIEIYIDGVLDSGRTATDVTAGATNFNLNNGNTLYIGRASLADYLNGSVDELGVWNRNLNATEVLEIYRRGANKIKFQVRSCNDSSCTGETWQGPDGTDTSYYSELNNCDSLNTITGACEGNVITGAPNISFSSTASTLPINQYFQYKAVLESEDDDACPASLPCFPSVKNVSAGPPGRFFGGSPEIRNSFPVRFTSLSGFSATSSGGCNPVFQISPNGGVFYYWDGVTWSVASNSTQANYASIINANIGSFVSTISDGFFYWRAYLFSNTYLGCEIERISVF